MATVFMAAYTNYLRDPRVRREAEALVAEGHRVVFMARRQPGESRHETVAGVELLRRTALSNKPDSFAAYLLDYLLFFVQLAAHLSAHPLRYRLVHINNMPDFLVFAAWLPRLLGRPVIHDIHDTMPELYMEKFGVGERHWAIRLLRRQERAAGRFASAVLTVEERLKEVLARRGIPEEKISVLINLPDERVFAPRPRPIKPPGAPFVLVYHGTLARRLGLDVAIGAVARLRQRIPSLEFRIVGAGEERPALLQLCERLGLQDVVRFSDGYVPVEAIPDLLADADLGIVPLRRCPATDMMLPTKLLEYVQMGIPCIVPETGTIARYFDDTSVRFFAAEDPESLADAIADLHDHPGKRESLARAATANFGSKYRWAEHKKVYVALAERLMRGTGAPACDEATRYSE
jgi:glycosyltransferase involved in cell wall biosynthesis